MINTRLLLIVVIFALIGKVARAQIAFVEDQDIDKKKANLAVSCRQSKPIRRSMITNPELGEQSQLELEKPSL